jgi:phytoene dehydrogenase-like protein
MSATAAGQQLTIVGAGIAGLVAAITAAEAGAQVVVHEAGRMVGGRGRSLDGEWKANYGPHAIYGDGELLPWLEARGLAPELARPGMTEFRARVDGAAQTLPLEVLGATLQLTGSAPHDRSFGEWALERAPAEVVRAAAGLASLPCFHAQPEQLSAEFVAWRLGRVTYHADKIGYVTGGWSTLVERLADHARGLGVEIELSSHVASLPGAPVVVATSPSSAQRLLGRELPTRGSRVALLDVGLSEVDDELPFAVIDLDERLYLGRYSAADPSLVPAGGCLVQCSAPLRERESHEQASRRLELALDAFVPDWRDRVRWRRESLATDSTGAAERPGERWQERPAIEQGGGVFLAGDYVAARGMLSEVALASGIEAAQRALELVGA